MRPLLKAPREDDSSFRSDLEQSIPNERPFMKFISLTKPMAAPHQIHTYTELRQQIHDDLRIQHPEWVERNGESSMRLLEQLDTLTRRGSNESIAAPSARRMWDALKRRTAANQIGTLSRWNKGEQTA